VTTLEEAQLTEIKTDAEVEDVTEVRPTIAYVDVIAADLPEIASV
jgi:hypothetical protein